MPSPPIVRLSQSLYSDVPSPLSAPSAAGTRKGSHAGVSPAASVETGETTATNQARVVRLLLPRTFAVADRAYHCSGPTAGGDELRNRIAESTGCSCYCCVEAAAAVQQQPSSTRTDGARFNSPCATAERSSSQGQGNSTSISDQQSSSSIRSQEGAVLVVVESVLGFSAVRALLDRSHAAAAASKSSSTAAARMSRITSTSGIAIECDQPPPREDPSRFHAADVCNHQDATATAVDDGDTFRAWEECSAAGAGGVSETVGRLVGWLRIAVASTALHHQGRPAGADDSDETRPKLETKGKAKRVKTAAVVATTAATFGDLDVDDDLLLAAAAATADGRAHGALYEVTERYEGGTEWSAFDLEPLAVKALGFIEGPPSGGRDSSAQSTSEEVLEVRLICHPLVTMVPDIRWCLRLIGQAKAFAALLNANAKLSTLGGGYFLTRQVGQAIHLALTQSEVATAMGDLQLAGKCRINVAYNYIWLGQYAEAERIIRTQVAASRAIHDEELETVAAIAARFLMRSRKANRRLLLQSQSKRSDRSGCGGDENGGAKIDAGGKWVRQRIDVKTDEWHRVRALPMYCSSGQATPVGWGDTSRGREVLPEKNIPHAAGVLLFL